MSINYLIMNLILISILLKGLYSISNITLKIEKNGINKIYNPNIIKPDEIYINGKNHTESIYEYNFTEKNNDIILVYYEDINSTFELFKDCYNITEIDLSHFNSSLVNDMSSMFAGCSALKSLYLSNLDISKVEKMNSMFYGCSSLSSLDISNFNTYSLKTMNNMFTYCSNLVSLKLYNFNILGVISMDELFMGCFNLKSLYLPKNGSSSITSMK